MSLNIAKILAGAALLGISTLCAAAPVVVTPGSLAGYSFSPPSSSGGGGGSSSGGVETLATCRVTPTIDTRTITLSTRNWFGYTKPVTVLYKIVGGGSGHAPRPQLESAGGSSVILKNGAVVAYAPGMNAGATARAPVSGSFTITSSDSLSFYLGGGGGGGSMGYRYYLRGNYDPDTGDFLGYTSEFYHTGVSGGGGAGYYGGGSGTVFSEVLAGSAPTSAAVAFGGTSASGGSGYRSGSSGNGGGGTGVAGGGAGTSRGADYSYTLWSGTWNYYYHSGGGAGYGSVGSAGGSQANAPLSCSMNSGAVGRPPLATSFDLSPNAGQPGSALGGLFPSGCTWPGGGYGEIVLQYQAPTCDLIPQYDQP